MAVSPDSAPQRKLRVLPSYWQDAYSAADYYLSHGSPRADALLIAAGKAVDKINTNPLLYRFWFGDLRRYIIPRFPYKVVYRVTDNEIMIIGLRHQRANPVHEHRMIRRRFRSAN